MITIERMYEASIDDVWNFWTTKDGIESWWGPDGFAVYVKSLDLRPGGEVVYTLTAVDQKQVEFMSAAGMPLQTVVRLKYSEVVPKTRLAYTTLADFIPDVEPYDVATFVGLRASGGKTHMTLTFDSMHDEHWTRMSRMGHESELEKLAMALH